jgi:hypothetical protein
MFQASRILLSLSAALLSAILYVGAARASLITEDMTFSDLGSPVATGSFSYDSSRVGILSYSDLASFNIRIVRDYDLNFLTTAATRVVQFAFNTSTQSFEVGGLFHGEILGGASSNSEGLFTGGFFISEANVQGIGGILDYAPDTSINVFEYDSFLLTRVESSVPEPSAISLFGAALVVFGWLQSRRARDLGTRTALLDNPSRAEMFGANLKGRGRAGRSAGA